MSFVLATIITSTLTSITSMAIPLPGGDKDTFGCIQSAGYQWCATKRKCYRSWEEICDPITTRSIPNIPTCGGFQNCAVYNDGCNNCICISGTQITSCTQRACILPVPGGKPPVATCTKCIDGYTFNSATNQCEIIRMAEPSCGGYANCNSYTNGCDICSCGIDGTDYSMCSGCAPGGIDVFRGIDGTFPPGMVFPAPHCTGCIAGYNLNSITNECESCQLSVCEDPCGPYQSDVFKCAEGAAITCESYVDCAGCYAKYYLNGAETTCTPVKVEPCFLPPCVNPCGPFEWGYVVKPYCEGYPNTRCQGYAECNRGCYAKYFDSITGEEIVDCVLVW